MGKWNHRPNRRFFRQEKLPNPNPLPFHPRPPSPSEFYRDGIPHWEKEYCTLVGSIPWWKVVEAKNNMYSSSSSNVVNWDDSAAEEAFQNAKKRFWADINRLPCDISLPAADIYIDEIDWNPFIDPDIVEEVDHAYFCPDDERNYSLEHKKRKIEDPDMPTNRWECDSMQNRGNSQNKAQGWNQGNNHDNPWERGITQSNVRTEINAWEDSRDKSWGSSQMGKDSISKDRDGGDNPWLRDCQDVNHVKASNRWGDPISTSWDSVQPKTRNIGDGENPWGCGPSQNTEDLMKDRGWKNYGGEEQRWKRCDSHTNQRNNSDVMIKSNGWGTRNHSGQKRGQPQQQNSRLQGSHRQTNGYCNDNDLKRGQSRQHIYGYQKSKTQDFKGVIGGKR